MRRYLSLLGVSLAASAISAVTVEPLVPGPTNQRGSGRRIYARRMIGFPANINRHTGKPHEHKREIARRLRQMGVC